MRITSAYLDIKIYIMIKDEIKFSQDIKVAMLKNNLNKHQLSEKMGLSYPTTLKYVDRPYSVNFNKLGKMCETLGLHLKIELKTN